MKKFFFGIFNLIILIFFIIFCLYESLQLDQHWNLFVNAFRGGDVKLLILKTLLLSLLVCFWIALVAVVFQLFYIFKEKNNPRQHIIRASKKAFAFIWSGTFWSRIWLYIRA